MHHPFIRNVPQEQGQPFKAWPYCARSYDGLTANTCRHFSAEMVYLRRTGLRSEADTLTQQPTPRRPCPERNEFTVHTHTHLTSSTASAQMSTKVILRNYFCKSLRIGASTTCCRRHFGGIDFRSCLENCCRLKLIRFINCAQNTWGIDESVLYLISDLPIWLCLL